MKAIIQKFYKAIPFKQSVFTALKSIWIPPQSVYQRLRFQGVIDVEIDKTHHFKMQHFGFELENELFWRGFGGWEKVSLELWSRLCLHSDVIYDIGANTGLFAMVAKCMNPNATVVAFEPVKKITDKISLNADLNNYDITIEDYAVAEFNGKAKIFYPDNEHLYSVTVNHNGNAPNVEVLEQEIDTIRLDSYVQNTATKFPDLLKIDVESYEPQVLQGMSSYLKEAKPTMLIEILSTEIGEQIEGLIEGLGYTYYKVQDNERLVKASTLLNKIVKEADDHNYLLCQPHMIEKLNLEV